MASFTPPKLTSGLCDIILCQAEAHRIDALVHGLVRKQTPAPFPALSKYLSVLCILRVKATVQDLRRSGDVSHSPRPAPLASHCPFNPLHLLDTTDHGHLGWAGAGVWTCAHIAAGVPAGGHAQRSRTVAHTFGERFCPALFVILFDRKGP